MRVFHRSHCSGIREFPGGTFFSETPIGDDSYGPYIYSAEFSPGKIADEAAVIVAARGLGLPGVECTYEYFSPNLVDAEISQTETEELIQALAEGGFDSAKIPDFVVPESFVSFRKVAVAGITAGAQDA